MYDTADFTTNSKQQTVQFLFYWCLMYMSNMKWSTLTTVSYGISIPHTVYTPLAVYGIGFGHSILQSGHLRLKVKNSILTSCCVKAITVWIQRCFYCFIVNHAQSPITVSELLLGGWESIQYEEGLGVGSWMEGLQLFLWECRLGNPLAAVVAY